MRDLRLAPEMLDRMRLRLPLLCLIAVAGPLPAQFLEEFDSPEGPGQSTPPGWSYATGDGQAVMDFVENNGYATIHVDARGDRRNIWWALIRRPVPGIDRASP